MATLRWLLARRHDAYLAQRRLQVVGFSRPLSAPERAQYQDWTAIIDAFDRQIREAQKRESAARRRKAVREREAKRLAREERELRRAAQDAADRALVRARLSKPQPPVKLSLGPVPHLGSSLDEPTMPFAVARPDPYYEQETALYRLSAATNRPWMLRHARPKDWRRPRRNGD